MNRIALLVVAALAIAVPAATAAPAQKEAVADDRHARGQDAAALDPVVAREEGRPRRRAVGARRVDRLRADQRSLRKGAEGDAELASEESRRAEACPARTTSSPAR